MASLTPAARLSWSTASTYTGGMLARASMSFAATAAYDHWGIEAPALMGAASALGLIATMTVYSRIRAGAPL